MTSDVNMSNVGGDGTHLVREEAMLLHYLRLLDDFVRRDLRHSLPPIGERCQALRDRLFTTQQLIADENRDQLAREYVLSDTRNIKHEDFIAWLQSEYSTRPHTKHIHEAQSKDNQPIVHDKKRPCFSSDGEGQIAGPLSERSQPSVELSMPALLTQPKHRSDSIPNSTTSETLITRSNPLEASHRHQKCEALAGNVAINQMESGPTIAHATSDEITASKNTRLAIIPCLRCKVLKRKCDTLQQCNHCPKQSDQNENDFWKVLGCFRGELSELADFVFRADFHQLPIKIYGFTPLSSRTTVRLKKPSRISDLARKMAGCIQENGFAALEDTSWEDVSSRHSLSTTVSTSDGQKDVIPLENNLWEGCATAWSLLRVVKTDPIYLGQTGYNLFTLLRLGNEMSPEAKISWGIFQHAERLVCAASELHLQVSGYALATSSNTDDTPSLELVDIKHELETFLESFERICSGRDRLLGHKQLACFYALLLFDVFKSLLIDICTITTVRANQSVQPPNREMLVASSWKDMDAVRINAMYKILVSVFAWASKSDLILDVEQSIKEQDDSDLFKSVQDTRKMLRVEDCRPQGIKGSKDFLLSLGSHLLDDNKYKGFFIQRFGVHSLTIRPVAKEAIIGISRTGHSDYVAHLPNLDSWAPSAETSRISDGWKSNAKIPSKELTWENTTLPRKRIRPVSEEYGNRSDDDRSRHGSRNGKLSPEVAEKAKRMRKLGACWRCRILKVPCSAGETCDRCNKVSQGSPDAHFLCSRASFRDYSEIFFPDFLHDHLEKPRYDATVHNLESDLIDTLCTTVTFDGKRSMLFQVNIFAPNEQYPRELIRRTVDGSVQTTTSHPVGLLGISSSEVKQTVQDYLKDVLAHNPPFIHSEQEATTAVNSVLSRLFNFSSCQERNIDILQQAFLVLVIYSVTGKTLFFMEPGLFANQSRLAENAHNQFRSAASSWLMDIALNNAMRTLALQTVKVLLSDLERAMRSRTRDRWAYCFAIILVLCSCVEEMQIWAVSLLDIEEKINGLGDLSRRKWVLHACTSLEEQPVRIIVDIFHSIYRSTADSSYGTASNLGFNPLKQIIRNGCRIPKGTDFGLEGHTVDLVRDMGQIVLHSYGELRGLAGPPNFEGTLEEIIKRNRGRLVSQFLLSFVDDTTIEEGLVAIDTGSTWMKPLSE